MLFTVLIITITVVYCALFCAYIIGWWKIRNDHTLSVDFSTKVSIIIPVRNEEKNILNCLNDISKQDYPGYLFEIIVVDDHSTDRTVEIIEKFRKQIVNENVSASDFLKVIRLKDIQFSDIPKVDLIGKKNAISQAIKISGSELIVTTDADCRIGKQWLASIVSYFEAYKPYLISAPVVFKDEESFFEKIQSLEFIGLIGIGASSIQIRQPNMCNGANLAYRRNVFNEVNGYEGNNSSSGDDEFLMHKIFKKYPKGVRFLKSKKAIVFTSPQKKIGDFIQQRKRWVSKSTRYNNESSTLTAWIVLLFNISLLINLYYSIFQKNYTLFALQIAIKFSVELIFFLQITRFFDKRALIALFIPSQFLHIIYVIFIAVYGNIGGFMWKERKWS